MTQADLVTTRVHRITYVTDAVLSFELQSIDGRELPSFSPGSHIDVHLPDGLVRSYSLVNPSDNKRFIIAVARNETGRGGSKRIHAELKVGQLLQVSAPRNNFELHYDVPHTVLVAGGIGITPIYAMIGHLEAIGAKWELHYGSRTPAGTAFSEELGSSFRHGSVHMYYSETHKRYIDLPVIIAAAPPTSHFYCCGPTGLLDAFLTATVSIPVEQVHIERFGGDLEVAVGGFDVVLARTGRTLHVGEAQTILDRLLADGIEVSNSCREGVCGACETPLLAGQGDHRDLIQSDREKAANKSIFVCCSGSFTPSLTLDL